MLRGVGGGGGSGTVTATGGSLTANAVVLGAGTTDTKVSTGIVTDGVGAVTLTPGANTTALTVASHTQTASNPALIVNQTFNNGAVTFTATRVNVTNTASAAGSLLADWQVGGVTKFKVDVLGIIEGAQITAGNLTGTSYALLSGTGVQLANGKLIRFSSSSTSADGSMDAGAARSSTGVVEINDGNTVGAFRDLKLRNLIGTGGVSFAVVAKTANYTLTANDYFVSFDATSGALTATLPAATGSGRIYAIKKITAANTVTIDGNASETIDGATTLVLSSQWAVASIQDTGTGLWSVI